MLRAVSCFVAAAMLGLGVAQAEDKSDQQLLQGTWKVVGGEAADKESIVGDLITFAGDNRMTIQKERRGLVEKESATFSLDPTKAPKSIDVRPEKNPDRGPVLGIYELQGDHLKMCLSQRGQPRPTKFDSPGADSIFLLVELERQK